MKNRILLVEDNPDELTLLLRAIERTGLDTETVVQVNSSNALKWLQESGRYPHIMPNLILLDIVQPEIDSISFLQRLRNDSQTQRIPVVIYTNCADDQVMAACSASGCNSYVHKPARYADFAETAQNIIRYWLTINAAPNNNAV
ncbi:MAG: response regulator [Formivibrio sp.]|nr:response regulator [Formivibrio sp.]